MAPDCANAKILALQMAQIFSVRDDFNFAQLTLMGKDTPTVLWFISETIYQSCFLQKYLRSNKNSQDSCSHSAIYNPFTRRLGFVLFFPTVAFCRTGRETAMSAPSYSYSAHAPSLRFSLLVFLLLAPAIHPCRHFLLPGSLAHVSGRTNTAPPTPGTHTNTLIDRTSSELPPSVWMGWTSHPRVPGQQDRWGGISRHTKECVRGRPCSPLHTVCLEPPKLPRDDTTHTPVKLWFICRDCDVTSLPSDLYTADTLAHKEIPAPLLARLADLICRAIELCDDFGLCVLSHWVWCTDANIVGFMAAEKSDESCG